MASFSAPVLVVWHRFPHWYVAACRVEKMCFALAVFLGVCLLFFGDAVVVFNRLGRTSLERF